MSRNDAELLAATAAGDANAFGCFYRRHETLVLGFAVHRCKNASDVADLVGDTFMGALRSAPHFAERDGDAVAWLLTIARRALAHQRRSFLDDNACALALRACRRSPQTKPMPWRQRSTLPGSHQSCRRPPDEHSTRRHDRAQTGGSAAIGCASRVVPASVSLPAPRT